ncbi:hypothetical protein BH10BAC4_BH10BAC4_07480 [soil metagenome]
MDKFLMLTHYIDRMVSDSRLKPIHLSLSIALCNEWIQNNLRAPYRVSRRLLMKASRIRSKATYHKTMRDLQMFGYLKYVPSYHPQKASKVFLFTS